MGDFHMLLMMNMGSTEYQGELADADHHGGEVAPGEGGAAEEVQVKENVLGVLHSVEFPDGECHENQNADDQEEGYGAEGGVGEQVLVEHLEGGLAVPPAQLGAFDDGEDDEAYGEDREEETEDVMASLGGDGAGLRGEGGFTVRGCGDSFGNVGEGVFFRGLGVGDDDEGTNEAEDAEGNVDEEDPAPVAVGGEGTADERADGGHAGDGGAPDTEGDGAASAGEVGVDVGQGGGHDEGGANALQGTGEDKRVTGEGGAGEDGPEDEDDEADDEGGAAADAVCEATDAKEERGDDNCVEGAHPLSLGKIQFEGFDDGGQGDVDDGAVKDDEGQAEGEHGEHCPFAPPGFGDDIAVGAGGVCVVGGAVGCGGAACRVCWCRVVSRAGCLRARLGVFGECHFSFAHS